MAETVGLPGRGGQRSAEGLLGWNRGSIRKGQKELESGTDFIDRFHDRGRKRVEHHLPNLLDDIRLIADPVSQTDPAFRSKRLYCPLTAKQAHRRLQTDKSYKASQLPSIRTISNKLSDLEMRPQRVQKCKPLKKIPETDAIFQKVHKINAAADNEPETIRISLDCKAVIKAGPFSRGGKNRIRQEALDHDFEPEEKLVPFGIFMPEFCESHFWFSVGPVTAGFTVDRLDRALEQSIQAFPKCKKAGHQYRQRTPESSGQRTQWLKRLVDFSDASRVGVELACYPPYHSKYNPIERLWGVMENHWSGELLTSTEKIQGLTRTMTYRGVVPTTVKLIRKVYKKGVRLTKRQMSEVENRLQRLKDLKKYFIAIG